MEKVRKAFYVEEELLGQVDALLPQADVRSRNEFVNQALRFYIGYLTSPAAFRVPAHPHHGCMRSHGTAWKFPLQVYTLHEPCGSRCPLPLHA